MNASRGFRRVGAAALPLSLLLIALAVPAIAVAEKEVEFYGQKFTLFGEGQIGLQLKEFTEGTRTSKFEEYQDIPRGFVFDLFQFGMEGKENPLYFRFLGKDISQEDQSFDVTFGRYGEFQVNFQHDEIPHFFSRGSKSLLTQINSTTFVFNNIGDRQFFTDNDPTSPPAAPGAGDAATSERARQLVNNAPTFDLRLKRARDKGDILYTLYPTGNLKWNLRLHVDNEQKDGNRALSTGTYERRGTPIGDTFRVLGIELPEPIRHTTTQVGFATDLAGEGWLVNLGYEYVNFGNDAGFLRWQNPFNNTDELAPGGGGLNRGRFAEAQIDLFPENHSHAITGSGSISLPFNTQFTGNLSSTWIFQNDQFLPYTLNTAILATNVPGTPAAATLALPKSSLDGEVRILTQSYALTNRAISNTILNAFYRYYDYQNETPQILFPGYVSSADSFWRTSIGAASPNPDGTTPSVPLENVPKSYTKQNAGVDASIRLLRALTVKAGYEYERWGRDHRETEATNEHIAKVAFDYKPLQWLLARVTYKYGDRQFQGAYERELEPSILRKFDQANRRRHLAETLLQVTPLEPLSVAGTFRYRDEDYGDTTFGLKRFHEYGFGVDVNYTPLERLTLYGFYVHEFGKFELSSIAKGAGSTEAAIFNVANQWDSSSDDRTQSVGAGFNAILMPDRLFLNVGYNYSLAKGKILTSNPNTIQSSAQLSAQAFPFPDTKSELHSIKAILNYVFNKNVSIGARYTFEQYRLNDFAWDNLQPYIFPISATSADNPVRFLLLDSRYSNYDVHVFGGFLNVRF